MTGNVFYESTVNENGYVSKTKNAIDSCYKNESGSWRNKSRNDFWNVIRSAANDYVNDYDLLCKSLS